MSTEPGAAPDVEGYLAVFVQAFGYTIFPSAAQVSFLFGNKGT